MLYRLISLLLLLSYAGAAQKSWIRVNQVGYLPDDPKVAVWVSQKNTGNFFCFHLHDARTGKRVWTSDKGQDYGAWGAFAQTARFDFSTFRQTGAFYIESEGVRSPTFRIGADVYAGTADFALRYVRQQRCGYNPTLRDSCHTHGGYIEYGDPQRPQYGQRVHYPIVGGWHDASDYLQYVTTTATAAFQLLTAYEANPSAFADAFLANGLPGQNGVPDVLDEAKWGLDWLLRMNPADSVYFNQVSDDRDHRGMRMPNRDTLTYDLHGSLARPVYRITGTPQGLKRYQNRTTGVSSSVAKFASAFAAGGHVLAPFWPEYAARLRPKAIAAFAYALSDTGVCQTAPCGAPYLYEEGNWRDDVALAATQLVKQVGNQVPYRNWVTADGGDLGWKGRDTAHHYQFYPFSNHTARHSGASDAWKIYYAALDTIQKRAQRHPFQVGTPFVWCSSNYLVAAATEAFFYEQMRPDDGRFRALRTAMRDWLLGCNPWGTSMVIGMPTWGEYPDDPHAALTHYGNIRLDGGLIDGPLYGSIFSKLIGLTLYSPDEFAAFQSQKLVYHDDYGDYSTNEPTMDGTASLVALLALQEAAGKVDAWPQNGLRDAYGAAVRLDTTQKNVYLVFTAHEYAEGQNKVLKTLRQNKAKAAFFLTGDCLRQHPLLGSRILANGHYLGAHSDKHLLYADWQTRRTMVSRDSFWRDLSANYAALQSVADFAQKPWQARIFLPPYEWHNADIAEWSTAMDLRLLNITPGVGTHADYTTPDMSNYQPSEKLIQRLFDYEAKHTLNGAVVLIHLGTAPARTDKLYDHLGDILKKLRAKGYTFNTLTNE